MSSFVGVGSPPPEGNSYKNSFKILQNFIIYYKIPKKTPYPLSAEMRFFGPVVVEREAQVTNHDCFEKATYTYL